MMRMFGPIKEGDGPGAMRERGFNDGYADRPARPPDDPKLAGAYTAGYRKGQTEHKRRAGEGER